MSIHFTSHILIFKVFGVRKQLRIPSWKKRNKVLWGKCVFAVRVVGDKDGSKVTTVVATTGSLPDRTQEISYTDTKVIGNGSFGVVYQARMCDSTELVAIKKVLQDKRFKVNIVRLLFFYCRTCIRINISYVFAVIKCRNSHRYGNNFFFSFRIVSCKS